MINDKRKPESSSYWCRKWNGETERDGEKSEIKQKRCRVALLYAGPASFNNNRNVFDRDYSPSPCCAFLFLHKPGCHLMHRPGPDAKPVETTLKVPVRLTVFVSTGKQRRDVHVASKEKPTSRLVWVAEEERCRAARRLRPPTGCPPKQMGSTGGEVWLFSLHSRLYEHDSFSRNLSEQGECETRSLLNALKKTQSRTWVVVAL